MVQARIMLAEYVILAIFAGIDATARGPHHPRGAKIVKHHVHYKPTREASEKITQDEELLHDTAHIREHLEEIIEEPPDLSNLSDEELEFYYFQLHDTDRNSKLDGLEILQAILHTSHHNQEIEVLNDGSEDEKSLSDPDGDFQYYVELIDRVLEEDDKNKDGYLSYPEYVAGRHGESADNSQQPLVNIIK